MIQSGSPISIFPLESLKTSRGSLYETVGPSTPKSAVESLVDFGEPLAFYPCWKTEEAGSGASVAGVGMNFMLRKITSPDRGVDAQIKSKAFPLDVLILRPPLESEYASHRWLFLFQLT